MPDNPTQPGQLPGQQFAVSNDATRNQSRMARLEERVKQLEKGKQLIQTSMFKWEQEATKTNITTTTFSIDLPMPPGDAGTGGYLYTDLPYWAVFQITAVGGAASGTLSVAQPLGVPGHSWTYSLAAAGNAITGSTGTAAALSDVGAASAAKAPFVVLPLTVDTPYGSVANLQITIAKTAGAGTGVTVQFGRVYAMIPPGWAT
jgi:hypothetical protein